MKLDRRTLLRGAGSVAIGLPALEEMTRSRPAAAQSMGVPERLVTVFFGLGLDPSWQRDFSGALEPYAGLSSKMSMCSVEVGQGSVGGAHCNTATVVFVGERQSSVNIAGGPSIDQRLRREKDPTGATLVSGIWWRRGACDAQAQRVYNPDGSPRPPVKRPSQVFDQVFGQIGGGGGSGGGGSDPEVEAQRRELRLRRSVLDTVMDQVRSLQGGASPLGPASKAKLDQHLQSIREIETQLAPADEILDPVEEPGDVSSCAAQAPTDPNVGADYDRFTYGTGDSAPEIAWPDYQRVFRLHADLWVTALRCDAVRFGNLMFESAGGHTNLRGSYTALGRSTSFPGSSQHDSYFHGNQKNEAELYQHFAQSNIAYFLEQLDDANHLEPNGKTVLDNTTVVIGTEYGWNHSRSQAFHAVAGGSGRFRSGFFTDRTMNCIDFYNAVLLGHGVEADIGAATNVDSEGDGTVILA
ncbi:MAG: DUF1552 domain-containing protein [Myxococcota bacterium]